MLAAEGIKVDALWKNAKRQKKHYQTLLSRNIFICLLSESVYFWISSVNLWKTRLTGYIGNEPWNGHWDNSSCERMAIRGEIFAPQLFCRDRHLIYTLLSPGMQAMNHHRCWQLVRWYLAEKLKIKRHQLRTSCWSDFNYLVYLVKKKTLFSFGFVGLCWEGFKMDESSQVCDGWKVDQAWGASAAINSRH